ncbi:hypothetical protein [Vibrio sp. B1REV9]|uniref:hypothetical protein n=1 Tax=Vibrio sp. B1REV9 TaxID=2751179 RepID=UPI001BA572F9|nr:hypothetical protein [Vibrio sp. B1REV9]
MNNTFRILLPILSLMLPAISYAKNCQDTASGNAHYEYCQSENGDAIWKKKTIVVDGKSFLDGVDKNGNDWTGVREIQGQKHITRYYNKKNQLIAINTCEGTKCSQEVISHYSEHGELKLDLADK